MNPVDPGTTDTKADQVIRDCLLATPPKSFFLYAGAGSGKTRSLITALLAVREGRGAELWMRGQRVAVITYTNKAADEIKRRLDYNALIEVSTIHSFAWTLLQGHTKDIREWLTANLLEDIRDLAAQQAKGRAASKAYRERDASIKAKAKRLSSLPSVSKFIYSPTDIKRGRGALAHAEVIGCVSALLLSKPMLQKILISRFPILLIDESQDTNKHLMDSLLTVQDKQSSHFTLGLFGDTMQRIYADGKVGLDMAIPATWAKPVKLINHRSRERIVRLANRIRASVDNHIQHGRPDKPGGIARLFIVGQGTLDKAKAEVVAASRMASITGDEEWLRQTSVQRLILEHHMAAARLGFSELYAPLYEVDNLRTGLLNGTLPAIRFLIDEVLPFVKASLDSKHFEAMAVLRRCSPLLTSKALKEAGKGQRLHVESIRAAAKKLIGLWDKGNDPSVEQVLITIDESGLFEVPDSLAPLIAGAILPPQPDDEEAEDPQATDQVTSAWRAACQVPFSQIESFANYISGMSAFDTHQGVKGLQFKRVAVIIDDDAARGFMFSYDRVLGAKPKSDSDRKNESSGQDSTLDRTRRLLYVICTRAEESLAIITYTQSPTLVLQSVVRESLFDAAEVEVL